MKTWTTTVPGVISVVGVSLFVLQNTFLFILGFPGVGQAQVMAVSSQHLPTSASALKRPPAPFFASSLSANAVYVSDEGAPPRVLYSKRPDAVFPLASLTKLMTALVVKDLLPDLDHEVVVRSEDLRGGSRTPLLTGAIISVSDLLTLALVSSDNTAAAVLARESAQSEEVFVASMNAKAKALYLQQTYFADPTGLSAKNVSSARDVAALARIVLTDPFFEAPLSQTSADVIVSGKPVRVLTSDQRLRIHVPQANGWTYLAGKTGFVDESGYNVALHAEVVEKKNVLVVLLGGATLEHRFQEAEQLLVWSASTANE